MNKRIKKLFSLGICIALLTPAAADAAPKKLPVEGVWEDWDYSGAYRIRRDFGLVEKGRFPAGREKSLAESRRFQSVA